MKDDCFETSYWLSRLSNSSCQLLIALKMIGSNTFYLLSISRLSNSSCHFFFGSLSLRGTANFSAVELVRLNTLRDTKSTILTPIRYFKHPCPVNTGVPPGQPIPQFDIFKSVENGWTGPYFTHRTISCLWSTLPLSFLRGAKLASRNFWTPVKSPSPVCWAPPFPANNLYKIT